MPDEKKVYRDLVTIGLPLPNLLEYTPDVSNDTRVCLNAMKRYSKERGTETHEIKARGINVAANHANLVHDMIGDWILVVGSDHVFAPNALEELLAAAKEPPYPRIIGAICPFRGEPYRYTFAMLAENGEQLFPVIPYKDMDMGQVLSGEVQEVDVIGSGFTLYHRSVFDTVPPPWFTYETRRPGMPELEQVLKEWEGETTFSDWLEAVPQNITSSDSIRLREKAKGLRRLLAKFRRPQAIGFDFNICLKAKEYGIKTYVHWGVQSHHLTLERVTPYRYLHWMENDDNWMRDMLASGPLTTERLQWIQEKFNKRKESRQKSTEQLVAERKGDGDDREARELLGGGEQVRESPGQTREPEESPAAVVQD